jgi:hypothetical protein
MSTHGITRSLSRRSFRSSAQTPHPIAVSAAVVVAALAISALANRFIGKRAERNNPPMGKFVVVRGVRLHYVEEGEGNPLVFLHGNAGMIQDFASSGLMSRAAERYRVIVFDRPGFGYSDRPRSTIWTAEAQADLLHDALIQIGVSRATVLWPFLGELGGGCACAEVSRISWRLDFSLRLFLPHCSG